MAELSERIIYFWTSLGGMSALKQNAVLEAYEPIELWDRFLTDENVFAKFLGDKNYNSLKRLRDLTLLYRMIDSYESSYITVLTRCESRYPTMLNQKEVCPPNALYCKGDLSLLQSDCIGIVGSRHSTQYGKDMTYRLVRDFCDHNATIVSGLATGIDTYAHAAALDNHGKTIAVLGSGINNVTPVANFSLAKQIATSGLLVSEYEPNASATVYSYPQRNRIISGLSKGVVVVEAGTKSGALLTANCALEQGRDVYSVPANVTAPSSAGCIRLLLEGAKLAINGYDICSDLHIKKSSTNKKITSIQLDILEDKVYTLLQNVEKMHFDNILEECQISPQQASITLATLEIKQLVYKLPGNCYSKQ